MNIRSYIFTTGDRESVNNVKDCLQSTMSWIAYFTPGKEVFWRGFNILFLDAEYTNAELYIFTPDDFIDIDLDRIKEIHNEYKHEPYVYNIINDGRSGQWTGIQERVIDEHTIMCGFTDCGFFCNREALESIGFYVTDPKKKDGSSGVGQQLSMRFMLKRIVMYKPVKSLATHGDHESIMHPEERKQNPLISI